MAQMIPIRKIAMTCGMALFAGVLMAQTQDQSPSSPNTPAPAAQAAPAQRRAPDPARQAKRLGKKLNLNQDQVSQLTPILAGRQQQIASVRSDTSLQPQDRRVKIKTIFDDSNTKMEAVMNDQQKQQFEQMMAARQNHRRSAPQAQ
jgi:periplasmic protein CpxP/Spy